MSIQSEINRIAGAKSDIADAIEDKGVTVPSGTKLDGMANLIGQIPGGYEKLNSTQAADAYDPTATYAVGDKVSYAGNVYSCISAISTPEAWDSTHWYQVDPIQDQVDDVRNTLNQQKTDTFGSINLTGTNTTGSTITTGTFFYNNGSLVRAKTEIQAGASITVGTNSEIVTDGALNAFVPKNFPCTYDSTYFENVDKNFYIKCGNVAQVHFVAQIKATIPNNTPVITGLPTSFGDPTRITPFIADNQYMNNATIAKGGVVDNKIIQFSLDSSFIGKWIMYSFTYICY